MLATGGAVQIARIGHSGAKAAWTNTIDDGGDDDNSGPGNSGDDDDNSGPGNSGDNDD